MLQVLAPGLVAGVGWLSLALATRGWRIPQGPPVPIPTQELLPSPPPTILLRVRRVWCRPARRTTHHLARHRQCEVAPAPKPSHMDTGDAQGRVMHYIKHAIGAPPQHKGGPRICDPIFSPGSDIIDTFFQKKSRKKYISLLPLFLLAIISYISVSCVICCLLYTDFC